MFSKGDALVAFAVALAFVGYHFASIFSEKNDIEMAKTGLEQCQRNLSSSRGDVIWVKDCNEHIKTLRNTK